MRFVDQLKKGDMACEVGFRTKLTRSFSSFVGWKLDEDGKCSTMDKALANR
jgi:hypothetical protein